MILTSQAQCLKLTSITNYIKDQNSDAHAPDAYILGIRDDSNAKLCERFPERIEAI